MILFLSTADKLEAALTPCLLVRKSEHFVGRLKPAQTFLAVARIPHAVPLVVT